MLVMTIVYAEGHVLYHNRFNHDIIRSRFTITDLVLR
jgi:hypothetical protein